MFPIRDHNPSERTPFVTYALMAANIVIFVTYWPLMNDETAILQFWDNWAMKPVYVANGDNLYTLVTSMFLHGGLLHLAGNMLFLWIFGDNLEDQLGHIPFLLFYLACGVLADFGQIISDSSSAVPNVGASGAIAGIMGAYLLLFPIAKVDILFVFIIIFKIFPVPAWLMLGLWLLFQVVNGLVADVSAGGVAYWTHAGGFAVGLILILPFWIFKGGKAFWHRTRGHPPHPEAAYSPSTIPLVTKR